MYLGESVLLSVGHGAHIGINWIMKMLIACRFFELPKTSKQNI